jgi:hypothetical protein
MRWRLSLALLLAGTTSLAAQARPEVDRERAEFATWLATAPLSPYAAIAVQPVGPGIDLGPDPADVPLSGIGRVRIIEERGGLVLVSGTARRALPRGRAVAVGNYQVVGEGEPGRRVVVVFGPVKSFQAPAYYPIDSKARVTVELAAPTRKGAFRTLGLDGVETQAEEVGTVSVSIGGKATTLRVYRMGAAEDDEAELMIFFRDGTSDKGTYPAGRFVVLDPAGGTRRYTIDFNRARNPFCAYNTVFPCPAPWPGNTLPVALEAGEKYGAGEK